jgi:tripeptide aminopeptidase
MPSGKGGWPMRLNLLKQLLALPTCSGREQLMVEFLMEHVRRRGPEPCGTAWADRVNNVYIRKGDVAPVPLVCAHLDTVHGWTEVELVEQDGLLVGFNAEGNRCGIGADDKCGIFVCLELLERFDNLAVALFAQEETAYVGARNADAAFFRDVGYAIEFDAPATALLSCSAGGQQLFQNDGEFIRVAMPVLRRSGFVHFQRHPFTDVTGLRQRFTFSCLNVSCGYHHWHTDHEHVNISEVEIALAMGTELITALGNRRYDFDASKPDTAPPPVEVTGLALPVTSKQPKKTLCTRS